MLKKSTTVLLVGLCVGLAGLVPGSAKADAIADFYKGKIITLVIGFGPGGGYDRYARVVSKHLGNHIPGNPKVIPQFMPGGGSLKMSNYLFNVAPQEGTYLGIHSPVIPIFQLIRSKGFKLDVRKFNYIGRLATQNHVFMVRKDTGVKTLQDAMKKQLIYASTGKGSPTFIYPTIVNNVLGTKFKVVSGYSGSASSRLAMERNEVQGMTSAWISWKATAQNLIDSKFMIPLVEIGLDKSKDLPGVPLLVDLAKNKDDRKLLEFVSSAATTGRALTAPPKMPMARVTAMRRAFDRMVKDPAFLAGAKKRKIEIEPLTGEIVQKRITAAVSIPKALVDRAKAALGFK